jgi:hypothetical protein
MKKIFTKTIWLILYLTFNIVVFFIEINLFFKKNNTSYSGNSGISLLDDFFALSHASFNVLGELAIVGFSFVAMGIALVAFLFFIPLQVYFLKPKYKTSKKKFLFSLLAAFCIVMIIKLIVYIWMFVDLNY